MHDPPEFNSEMDIYWFADPFCQTEGAFGRWQFHLQDRNWSYGKTAIFFPFQIAYKH